MNWSLINYELLTDCDDYSIIFFKIDDIDNDKNKNIRYLENIITFLDDFRKLYRKHDLQKQI